MKCAFFLNEHVFYSAYPTYPAGRRDIILFPYLEGVEIEDVKIKAPQGS
jgi:hypothetical protein